MIRQRKLTRAVLGVATGLAMLLSGGCGAPTQTPPTEEPVPVATEIAPPREIRVKLHSRPLHGEPPFTAGLSGLVYPDGESACRSVLWDFDDGSESEQPCSTGEAPWHIAARHTYASAGTYHPRATLALADGRSVTSNTQTVVVAEPQPVPPARHIIYWSIWAASLLAVGAILVWLRRRSSRMRIAGIIGVGLLLITFVPPFSYVPDPLGVIWGALGGYAHDPRLPFADRFLVAGSPVASLRPWLDGLIGQTGLDPLDPTSPLDRYDIVRVQVPSRFRARVEVVTRFTYADGSQRTYAIPLYQSRGGFGFRRLYQSEWTYDGLARLRTEHRELAGTPFAGKTSAVRLGEPQRLLPPRQAQDLDTADPSNWYWRTTGRRGFFRQVAWSPDGESFLTRSFFSHDRDDLWLVPADGGRPERLVEGVIDFGWSPDGETVVAFARRGRTQEVGLLAISIAEGWQRQLAPPTGTDLSTFPGLSDEGVWYASEGDLWLAPYDGGPARRIEAAHWGAEGPVRPSPDGSTIAYGCSAGVCLQDRSGGSRSTIDAEVEEMAWSPDGSRLAAVVWEGREDVVLTVAAQGGPIEHRLTIAPDGAAGAPQWTSDGERLFVQTSPFGGRRIVTVDAESGAVLDLSEPRWDAWFDLGPKGERLLLTNGRGGFSVVEVIVD